MARLYVPKTQKRSREVTPVDRETTPEDDGPVKPRKSLRLYKKSEGLTFEVTKAENDEKNRKNIFPFLKLPPEIRNMIYNALFSTSTPDNTLDIGIKHNPRIFRTGRGNQRCELVNFNFNAVDFMRVSKQIRNEVFPVFWGKTFYFKSTVCLLVFLEQLPKGWHYGNRVNRGNVTNLKHIQVSWGPAAAMREAAEILYKEGNLETIESMHGHDDKDCACSYCVMAAEAFEDEWRARGGWFKVEGNKCFPLRFKKESED